MTTLQTTDANFDLDTDEAAEMPSAGVRTYPVPQNMLESDEIAYGGTSAYAMAEAVAAASEPMRPTPGALEASVFDVAEYILRKALPDGLSTLKLQKLVYYAQAWSLVWDERPLFDGRVEAWVNGPVIPRLFNLHRGQFRISQVSLGNPSILTQEQRDTVDAVWEGYGDMSAQELVALSHAEAPWRDARTGLGSLDPSKREITAQAMAMYYGSL
jgi:uncharacterized phage-associated protein